MLAQPEQWSPATTLPELSLSTSSSTSSPRSATCSLSSSFSDVSPEALSTPPPVSKTHAFFSSPFSTTPSPPPAPPKSPSQASTRSLNNDFFASFPHSARPTPPPSLYTPSSPNSRDPSPPNQLSLKLRLPPLSRLFPSRYNSDPTSWRSRDLRESRTKREFVDLDADATPHPQRNTPELYFGDLSTKGRRVLEEEDNYESPTESTPSPKDNFFKGVYAHALEAGTVIDGYSNEDGSISLSLIRALGRGAFSSVWLAQDVSQSQSPTDAGAYSSHFGDRTSDGRLVAVKVAPRDNHVTMLTFEREAKILRHITHPNIAPLLGSFSLPTRQILVLPYIVGGDLLDLVNSDSRHGQLTEGLLRRIVVELVGAVGWLHSGMGEHVAVVHRDIKLENILLTPSAFPSPSVDLTKPLIKLTDFGLSRMIDTADPLLSTRCGSEAYAAPELVVGRIASQKPNSSSSGINAGQPWDTRGWYDGREMDAWAVGVVVYALMCRALPFGEGVPVGGDDRIDRKFKSRGRERERERERKSWLMRIAKGEYEWPSLPPPSPPPLPHGQQQTDNSNTPNQSELLRGTRLAHIPRARKVVERLLVRDPKKRATLKDLRDDEWFVESPFVVAEGQLVNRDTIGPMAWQEIE